MSIIQVLLSAGLVGGSMFYSVRRTVRGDARRNSGWVSGRDAETWGATSPEEPAQDGPAQPAVRTPRPASPIVQPRRPAPPVGPTDAPPSPGDKLRFADGRTGRVTAVGRIPGATRVHVAMAPETGEVPVEDGHFDILDGYPRPAAQPAVQPRTGRFGAGPDEVVRCLWLEADDTVCNQVLRDNNRFYCPHHAPPTGIPTRGERMFFYHLAPLSDVPPVGKRIWVPTGNPNHARPGTVTSTTRILGATRVHLAMDGGGDGHVDILDGYSRPGPQSAVSSSAAATAPTNQVSQSVTVGGFNIPLEAPDE